jgi:hypothetical protein
VNLSLVCSLEFEGHGCGEGWNERRSGASFMGANATEETRWLVSDCQLPSEFRRPESRERGVRRGPGRIVGVGRVRR